MTYDLTQFQPTQREQRLRSVFGLAAVAATALTLGLAVVAPTQLASSAPAASLASRSVVTGPTEVAILPAKIQVVGARAKSAQGKSPYVTVTYNPRG